MVIHKKTNFKYFFCLDVAFLPYLLFYLVINRKARTHFHLPMPTWQQTAELDKAKSKQIHIHGQQTAQCDKASIDFLSIPLQLKLKTCLMLKKQTNKQKTTVVTISFFFFFSQGYIIEEF